MNKDISLRRREDSLMKKTFFVLFILFVLTSMILHPEKSIRAPEITSIEVAEAAICRNIEDREPIDSGDTFKTTVDRLYCFTKITGAQTPIEIVHVWNFGDTVRATINLPIKSSNWRTWSSKKIQAHEIGDWHVDVIGPDGNVLKTLKFKIVK